MKSDKLQSRLVTLLRSNKNTPMSYKDIAIAMNLTKREKEKLASLLAKGVEDKLLNKTKQCFLLVEQPQKSTIQQRQISPKLIEGYFDATPLSRDYSYAFVRTEDKDYYISSEDTLNAYHNDKVAIELKSKKGKFEYGVVRRIVSRYSEDLAGDIVRTKNKWTFICSNPKIHNWFDVIEHGTACDGDKVILHVSSWGSQILGIPPSGKIVEVLGRSGDPKVELVAILKQYNLPMSFPDSVINEINDIDDIIPQAEVMKRKDLRSLLTFTIDPSSAKDYDDAISIIPTEHGWKLFVHIADVAHYLPTTSAIFNEAVKRGNSFYFPKKVIPMIPEKLSNQVCSLRPLEDKLCLTVETEFNTKGKITSQHMYESVICSDYRLIYEDVDTFFNCADVEHGILTSYSYDLREALSEARKLSTILTDIRRFAGYIFFDLPEIEFQYNEDGFLHRLSLNEETESHKLIENFMLVANEFVAKKLSMLSPTTIYRIHENPDQEKLTSLQETLASYGIFWELHENMNKSFQYLLASFPSHEYHEVFDRIVLRSMKKARYSIEHISHFGLAMDDYTHFTSPIRRLCDLVIHHLCKIYIIKTSRDTLSRQQIKLYAQIASEQELKADQAERDVELLFSKAFMKEKIGEHFTGIVVGCNAKGVLVRLNEIPIWGLIKVNDLGKGIWDYNNRALRYVNRKSNVFFQLMDKLKIVVSSVEDDIYLHLQDTPDAHRHFVMPEAKVSERNQVTYYSQGVRKAFSEDARMIKRHKKLKEKKKPMKRHG